MRESTITYTYPMSIEAMDASELLLRAQAAGAPEPEMERIRAELADSSAPEVVRITLGQASVLEFSRYNRLRAEAIDEFKRVAGSAPDDPASSDAPDDAWSLLGVGMHRAYMMAVLRRFERFQRGAWVEEPLPDEWSTTAGMANNMPAALFERWADTAKKMNAGLFWTDDTEWGKASGGGSVIVRTI